MEFGVLGPVEVTAGGRPLAMGGARARAVLAVLLAHASQVVPADQLTDELWPGQPERLAQFGQPNLQAGRCPVGGLAGEADRLATRPPGYLLTVTPAELDSLRFAHLAGEGDAALAAGDPATAAQWLDEALLCGTGLPSPESTRRPCGQRRAGSRRCA